MKRKLVFLPIPILPWPILPLFVHDLLLRYSMHQIIKIHSINAYVCTQREYDTEWSFQMLCALIGNHVVMEGTFLRKEQMMNQIATTKTTRWCNVLSTNMSPLSSTCSRAADHRKARAGA